MSLSSAASVWQMRMTVTFDKLPTIPVFLDAKKLSAGVPAFLGWDTSSTTQHHWLVGGNSGAGKSYSLMLMIAKIWRYMPDMTRLWLMDFKGSDDFHYLRGIPNARYYFHDRCAVGLQEFGEEMESRLRDNPDRSPVVAVFDEYASFISYTQVMDRSKKPEARLAPKCEVWLMNALFLSRGVGGYCVLCTQRPDQSILPSGGARDQLGCRVWWGRFSSREEATMMFGDEAKLIPEDYVGGLGHGIAYMDGKGLFEVVSPRIRRMDDVKEAIRELVTR